MFSKAFFPRDAISVYEPSAPGRAGDRDAVDLFPSQALRICHIREATGGTNNINDGLFPSRCPSNPCLSADTNNTSMLDLEELNGMQPSFMLLILPLLFIL